MTTLPQLLQMARVHAFVHRNLDDPHLDPRQIAEAVNMSLRALHQLFQDNDDTPMRLVKRLRLEKSRRDLEDSAQATTLIKEIGARHGYARPERFTRDFKQKFGSSPREVRP